MRKTTFELLYVFADSHRHCLSVVALTAGILITVSLMFTVESFTIDSRNSEAGRLLMIILLLVPHCLLWGRVVRRLLKFTTTHRSKSSERESLLNRMISNNEGVLVNV